jgi:Na+/H+-dicarboxylate symporter
LVFAPFALITGILALNQINNSDKWDGKGRAWFGVVMGALGTIGLIVVIAMRSGG